MKAQHGDEEMLEEGLDMDTKEEKVEELAEGEEIAHVD